MDISARAAQLSPSLTLSIDSKAKAMKAEGIDVCGFGAGEPDFDTPEHIKAAAIAALEAGFTKYTPSAGLPELRQAIADKFKRENGLSYKPSQVIVSCGGYPFDLNLIQGHKALEAASQACNEGGTIVLVAECADGLGRDDFLKWFDAGDSTSTCGLPNTSTSGAAALTVLPFQTSLPKLTADAAT